MIGAVYYADDPYKRVFRTVHLATGEKDSVLDHPRWITEGVDPRRPVVLERMDENDKRLRNGGTPWTSASEPLPVPSFPDFSATPDAVVATMLDIAKLGKTDLLVDIGSGDGRIVIAAAKRGVKAYGIEIDPVLCEQSRAAAKLSGLAVQFINANVFDCDLSGVTVAVVSIGDPWIDKIAAMLPKSARIVALNAHPDFAAPDVVAAAGEYKVSAWAAR